LDDYLLTHSVEAFCAIEPLAVQNPATEPGEPVAIRHGDEHRVTWPQQQVEGVRPARGGAEGGPGGQAAHGQVREEVRGPLRAGAGPEAMTPDRIGCPSCRAKLVRRLRLGTGPKVTLVTTRGARAAR